MKLAILGATGQVGSQLTTEALSRGHTVTGISRHPDALPNHPQLKSVKADLTDYAELPAILAAHDAVIAAVKFATLDGAKLLAAVKRSGAKRFLVVGGAGSLETTPGQRLVDQPEFPAAYKPEALAAGSFWRYCAVKPSWIGRFYPRPHISMPAQKLENSVWAAMLCWSTRRAKAIFRSPTTRSHFSTR